MHNSSWPSLKQYFLKADYRDFEISSSPMQTALSCFICYILMQIVNIFQLILLSPVAKHINDRNTSMFQTIETLKDKPLTLLFLFVIFAPLTEELWFRFGLRRYNWKIMTIWSFSMVIMIFIFFFDARQFDPIAAFSISFFFALFLYFFTKKEKVSDEFWHKNFIWIFWGSSLLFGLAHYQNFLGDTFSLALTYTLVIYMLTRGILGAILAYSRMRFGFIFAVFIHALNNAVPAMAFLLVPEEYWQQATGLIGGLLF